MTTPQFAAYSRYYDLFYSDKDYVGETAYLQSLVTRFAPNSNTLLELGCGTGRHAVLLAEQGFHVTGVELSQTMLDQAKDRAADLLASSVAGSFEPREGDARTFRCAGKFDCVVSLFHVVSYQTANADVQQMFETAAVHLKPSGLFVFDVWYGPAVVTMRPAVRVKRLENETVHVMRIAEPALDMNQNRVDVNYTVLVTDKKSGSVEQLHEQHRMRYYFAPELEFIAESVGLQIVHSEEWMTGAPPTQDTWGVTFIARKA